MPEGAAFLRYQDHDGQDLNMTLDLYNMLIDVSKGLRWKTVIQNYCTRTKKEVPTGITNTSTAINRSKNAFVCTVMWGKRHYRGQPHLNHEQALENLYYSIAESIVVDETVRAVNIANHPQDEEDTEDTLGGEDTQDTEDTQGGE